MKRRSVLMTVAAAALWIAWRGAGRAARTPEAWADAVLASPAGAFDRLSAAQRDRIITLARREFCPCGCGHDALGCVETDPRCPSRPEAARMIGRIAAAVESGQAVPEAKGDGLPSVDEIKRTRAIGVGEARRLLDGKRTVFLDARKPPDYERGHIAGALNCPVQEFERLLPTLEGPLRSAATIVTYCPRGCSVSALLARKLLAADFKKVRVLEGGWDEWRDRGQPVSFGDRK